MFVLALGWHSLPGGLEVFPAQVAAALNVYQFSGFNCDIETRRTGGFFILETRAQMSRGKSRFFFFLSSRSK